MSVHSLVEVKCDGYLCNARLQFYTDNTEAAQQAAVRRAWWRRNGEIWCPVHIPVHGAPDLDAPYDDGLRHIPNLGLGRNRKEELPPR